MLIYDEKPGFWLPWLEANSADSQQTRSMAGAAVTWLEKHIGDIGLSLDIWWKSAGILWDLLMYPLGLWQFTIIGELLDSWIV